MWSKQFIEFWGSHILISLSFLVSGIATTCNTLRQNLGDVISLHPYMNFLHHAMYTNLREWAHVHRRSHVLFSDTTAPKLLGCHSMQVTFQISCLLTVHSTTLSWVQHKLCDMQIYIKKQSLMRHIRQFFRLLVLALLTSHYQKFFFIKRCPVETSPCIWDSGLIALQYMS